jgi:hypothetical protein
MQTYLTTIIVQAIQVHSMFTACHPHMFRAYHPYMFIACHSYIFRLQKEGHKMVRYKRTCLELLACHSFLVVVVSFLAAAVSFFFVVAVSF